MEYTKTESLCDTLRDLFNANDVVFVNAGTENKKHGVIIQFHDSHMICLHNRNGSDMCREIGVYRNANKFNAKENEYSSIVRSGKLSNHLGKPIYLIKYDFNIWTWFSLKPNNIDVSENIAKKVYGVTCYDTSLTLLLNMYEFYNDMHMIDKKEIDDWNDVDLVFMDEYVMGYITKY